MKNLTISVEATCDLTPELLQKYSIDCIPMHYYLNEKEFSTADHEFSNEDFFNIMKNGGKTSTSQINEYEAEEFFKKLLERKQDIVHIAFSSALSGNYNNLKSVAEKLNAENDNKIFVIDSKCASTGHGLLAILAREKAENCTTTQEVVDFVEDTKLKISHLFVVDSLKYLARTGRISKVTATIGTVLQIKPVLYCDNNGCLTTKQKVISRKKSLKTLVEKLVEMKNNLTDKIFIAHANCLEEAEEVKNLIKEKTQIEAQILPLGQVIGSHSGPGTLAVFFTSNER